MSNKTFYFESTDSPTQFNLQKHLLKNGFSIATNSKNAGFSDINLTLNEKYTQQLEYKHLLAELTERHCPEIMPLTYAIDDANYSEVIEAVKQQHPQIQTWILKPALLNNAVGIKIFTGLEDIQSHFIGSNRFAGQHVLQQYILHPHLLNGHKYTFRMFVIITNYMGVYLYKYGYFNVGREAYNPDDFTNFGLHLTNEHLNPDDSPNIYQIPTTRCPNFDVIYEQMKEIVTAVIQGLNKEAPDLLTDHSSAKAFSLFGFDFILDDQLKLWLLEINHGPCFPKEEHHILQEHLYNEFWEAIIESFVKPTTTNNQTPKVNNKLFDLI